MNFISFFVLNHKIFFFLKKSQPEQVIPFPEYPVLQVQLKLPGVFVQVACESQLSVFKLHSSISKLFNCLLYLEEKKKEKKEKYKVPVHETPFPEYPELHLQVKLPIVLLHVAWV